MRIFFAALTLATACTAGFEAEIGGRTPFDPPSVYVEWWRATEACADRRGRFEDVVWYLADWITGGGAVARGRWSEPHDIVVVRGYEDDATVVRHEMLHDLLRGDREHAAPEWEACGLLQ